ncbi:MAG: hypothetical protein RIK87_16070 [Fuerstiella sp.]
MGNDQVFATAWLRAAIFCAAVGAGVANQAAASDSLPELAKRVGVRVLAEGTSDEDVLMATKARLPWSRMSASSRRRGAEILSNVSQYRRMPQLQYQVNPEVYRYLVRHPDVAVSTWRVMGISKLEMWQTGEFEYEASAADGSEGIADVLYQDPNQCLFIVQGKYTSPLLPAAIQASALVWLQYRMVHAPDGTPLVNQQVEAFIHFPSNTVDVIARLASRVTNSILDRNVFEVSLYAKMMSKAAEQEPEWVEHLAGRMEGVLPQRRQELINVACGQAFPAASMMAAERQSGGRATMLLPHSQSRRHLDVSLQELHRHAPVAVAENDAAKADNGRDEVAFPLILEVVTFSRNQDGSVSQTTSRPGSHTSDVPSLSGSEPMLPPLSGSPSSADGDPRPLKEATVIRAQEQDANADGARKPADTKPPAESASPSEQPLRPAQPEQAAGPQVAAPQAG